MAPNDLLKNRIRVREEAEDEADIDSLASSSDQQRNGSDSDEASEAESAASDNSEGVSEDEEASDHGDISRSAQPSINDISFGALAQAQASLSHGKRKRPHQSDSNALDDLRKRLRESKDTEDGAPRSDSTRPKHPPTRTSKHAPMAQSSKYAVSRKRIVVEPTNTVKPRDPRFDKSLQGFQERAANTATISKQYAFLTTYQDSEMAALRTRIQKTKDADAKMELKKALVSMENKKKAAEAVDAEREILRRHRKKEQQLIREGKKEKPWFLKKGDVKKDVLVEKFKGMKDKEREQVLAKRRKRKASKEKKSMPFARRGFRAEI